MKLRYILKFSLDLISKRKLNCIFIIAVCLITIFFGDLIITEYEKNYYIQYEIKEAISVDTDKLYYIDYGFLEYGEIDIKKIYGFFEEIEKDYNELCIAGMFSTNNILFKELKNNPNHLKLRETMLKETYITDDSNDVMNGLLDKTKEYTSVIYIDNTIKDICNTKLSDKKLDNGNIPIIIGYNYSNFLNVGDTLTDVYTKKTYEVVDVLEKNSKWLNTGDIASNIKGNIDLDNYIICIDRTESVVYDSCYINFNNIDKKSIIDTVTELEVMAKKYGYNVNIKSIESIFGEIEEDLYDITKSWYLLEIFIFLVGIISISAITIILILLYKSDIGIMYANGFNNYDITRIFIINNIIEIGIGCIMGYCLSFIYIIHSDVFGIANILIDIQISKCSLYTIGIFIINSVISSFVPILYLKKFKPVDLIRR